MKVLIYGGGAVGLGLASCLLRSRVFVDLVAREETVSALRKAGLRRTGIFGETAFEPGEFRAAEGLEDFEPETWDFVCVCTKSFDSAEAATALSGLASVAKSEVPIILFQNGWGNAEKFAERFSRERLYNGRVITGFTRPEPNRVDITVHADDVRVGSLYHRRTEPVESLTGAIAEGGLPCRTTEEIARDLWAKMLYNCALNGLGAIFGVRYGVLGEHRESRELMGEIVEEVYAVMAAEGFETHWADPAEYLANFYERQLPPTARHEPSTLQDLRAGKRTEIDALNGAVAHLGGRAGVKVPLNRAVTRMVKFLEWRARS